jgi:hypothetical protein
VVDVVDTVVLVVGTAAARYVTIAAIHVPPAVPSTL